MIEDEAQSLDQQFIKTVGRHFVTLSCVQTLPGTSTEKILVFSGFLVNISGVWFYVTAGHILKNLRTALNAGVKFDVWRLGDQTAGDRFKGTAIPYSFDIERWLVIENESVGLDYATTPLEDMYCQLLNAGGATPINKHAWGDHVTEHDQWALVGIPSETVSYDGKTIIQAKIVVAPIERIEAPVMAGSKIQNQFFGRLKEDSTRVVHDIDGMSGGPIFALKKVQGTWKYSVIGIQSGWYRSDRIIAACPFSSLGFELESIVLEVLSSQKSQGGGTS